MKQKKDNDLIKKIIKRAGQCAEESASVFFLYQPKKIIREVHIGIN